MLGGLIRIVSGDLEPNNESTKTGAKSGPILRLTEQKIRTKISYGFLMMILMMFDESLSSWMVEWDTLSNEKGREKEVPTSQKWSWCQS